ncbi:MAG: PEP-CTERM sorting domain-containing protein [Planctomycetaceae bacterium]|nr:PEP-CTERM sorting domain-containing protein [Planctomycetaceae bacterium]
MKILTAIAVVLAAGGTLWAAPVTVFQDTFDGYSSWQNPDGGWQNPGSLSVADRGGGDKYIYSVAYNVWAMPYHSASIDWANVDKVTITASMMTSGARTWVGLTRNSAPTEEMFYMGEYGFAYNEGDPPTSYNHFGIKWDGVLYASTVRTDAAWHTLSMVIDQTNDRVDLFIDGGTTSIATVNGLGTSYLDIGNIGMRIQKHGYVSAVSDVLLQTEIVAPVPEPATMSLLALGGVAAVIRRRRK